MRGINGKKKGIREQVMSVLVFEDYSHLISGFLSFVFLPVLVLVLVLVSVLVSVLILVLILVLVLLLVLCAQHMRTVVGGDTGGGLVCRNEVVGVNYSARLLCRPTCLQRCNNYASPNPSGFFRAIKRGQ